MTHIKSLTPEQFAARYKLLICDADGTLRRCNVAGQPCPNQQSESVTIPQAKRWLSQINWTVHEFGIASNQGGVSMGYISEMCAYGMLADLAAELVGEFNVALYLIQMCSVIDKANWFRKPNIGMLQRIMSDCETPPSQTLMVGDRPDDRIAAETALCDFIWAWDLFGFERPAEVMHFAKDITPEPTEVW
jgi:D-glycero-D-manno-heptose 1,7-bisphosphate phosphatase